jgi:hypothetical protein
MSEHQLDQVLQTAARQAQRAAAAALDIEGQLAMAKAAVCTSIQDGQAGIPDSPEPGPEGRYAAPVIALRLIACKLDRALKMARDLTRGLLPFYQHDLDALNERVCHRQDLGTFRSRVLFPRSRGSRLSRSRARGASLGASLEYEFAPAYQTLRSVPGPALGIARALDRDRRPGSGHALACDRVLNRDRALALDLALDLARDLASELDAATGADGSLAPGFLLARDKILELEAVMFRALDLAVSLDRARAAALDRDCGITLGRELGGDADRSAAGTWEAADALSVALDRALSLNPVSVLVSIAVDVSGLDLSCADIDDLNALGGVTFTAETTWPPGITQSVRARSEEIRPGVYQICDTGEGDAASPAIACQAAAAAPSGDYRTPAARQADGPAVPCPHDNPGATRNSSCELTAPPPLR